MYATRVSERVYLLDTYAMGVPGTVGAYLIKGPKPALIDCGYASSSQSVLAGMAEAGVMPSEVRYLIPTHVHLDHAGGAGELIDRMPNAEVIAHERSIPHLVDPTRLIESATMVFGKTVMELYGLPKPIREDRITAVGRELHLDLGEGLGLTLMHSPGHAPHQISAMLDGTGALFTADAVGIVYPDVGALIPTTPPPSFDPGALVATIATLKQTTPRELLVPHFGSRKDVDWVFDRTAELVLGWVRQVEGMWKAKATLDQVAERMEQAVTSEAGTGDLPIHAKVSIRVSVMGIMHYLDKNR